MKREWKLGPIARRVKKIDAKAYEKGGATKGIWIFVKFAAVGLFTAAIQIALVNLLYFLMRGWTEPLPGILGILFTEKVMGVGHDNWGYLLPFLISNLIANTLGYIINKKKTFKSDAPRWHYVIFIVALVILVLFTTWLQGVIVNWMIDGGLENLAPSLSSAIIGTVQGVALFPLQKFVLLKERTTAALSIEEATAEEAVTHYGDDVAS